MAPTERRPKLGVVGPSRSLDTGQAPASWLPGLCRTLSDFRGRRSRGSPGLGEELLRRSREQLGETPKFLVRLLLISIRTVPKENFYVITRFALGALRPSA